MRDIVKKKINRSLKKPFKPGGAGFWLRLYDLLLVWNHLVAGFFNRVFLLKLNTNFILMTIYALLVVVLTWPLLLNMSHSVPGLGNDGGDGFMFLWNIWWVKKQVLSGGDIYYTDYIFFPYGVNLIFHTLALAQSLVTVVLSYFLTMVESFNLVYMVFIWMSAVFTYLLVKELWQSKSAAFVAGLIYAFCPYVFIHSLGHFNLTTIWPFPALVFFIYKMQQTGKIGWSVLAGCALGFIFMNDFQYFVLALILVLMLLVYNFFISNTWSKSLINGKILPWSVFVVVSSILIIPLLIKSLNVSSEYMPKALLSEVTYWSADLLSFVVPSFLHPFWGNWGEKLGVAYAFSGIENYLYLGLVVLIMFVVSVWINFTKRTKKRREVFFWQMVTIVFLIFSLGPILKIGGESAYYLNGTEFNVALPYVLLYKLPLFSASRVPARFIVITILALAVLSGYVIREMLFYWHRAAGKWGRGAGLLLVAFITILVLLEYASFPIRLQSLDVPPVYTKLAAIDDDRVILELPLWWTSGHRTDGDPKTKIQYYQTVHEKKILNGSVSRVPLAIFDSYQKMPGISYLIYPQNEVDEAGMNKDRVLNYWCSELDIGYIIVHKDYFELDVYYNIRSYLENVLNLKEWYQDETELVYEMTDQDCGKYVR